MSEPAFTIMGASHPDCPDIRRTTAAGLLPPFTRAELKALFRKIGVRWRGPIEFMSRRAGERQGFMPGTERSFFRLPAMDPNPTSYWTVVLSPNANRLTLLQVSLAAPVPEFN